MFRSQEQPRTGLEEEEASESPLGGSSFIDLQPGVSSALPQSVIAPLPGPSGPAPVLHVMPDQLMKTEAPARAVKEEKKPPKEPKTPKQPKEHTTSAVKDEKKETERDQVAELVDSVVEKIRAKAAKATPQKQQKSVEQQLPRQLDAPLMHPPMEAVLAGPQRPNQQFRMILGAPSPASRQSIGATVPIQLPAPGAAPRQLASIITTQPLPPR